MQEPVDFTSAVRSVAGGTEIELWVVPGASKTEITGVHDGAVRIRVSAPAEGGKANRALEQFLGRRLGIAVEVTAGASGRRKRCLARGMDPGSVADRLA
jgi:uncharacterized protein (TIGR00251 family)